MKFHHEIRLTDDLERQLLQQVLHEQNQLRPLETLKKWILRLIPKTSKA